MAERAEDWVNPAKIKIPRGGLATMTVSTQQVAAQQEGYEKRLKVQVAHINRLMGDVATRDAQIMAVEAELVVLRQQVDNLKAVLAETHTSGVIPVEFVPTQTAPDPAESAFDGGQTSTAPMRLEELASPDRYTQSPAFDLSPLGEERPGRSL